MKKILIYMLLMMPVFSFAQEERKYIREGYKSYMDKDYNEAEIDFRKAEEAKDDSYIARYNTSTALYQQDNLEESGKRFTQLLAEAKGKDEEAKLLHNLGNVMLKSKKYQEAAEAYKRSLRKNPGDEDTRYNLAYALEKLEDQQQQQQQQQQNKNQDQKNNKDQKDQQQENQQEQQKQNENQEQQDQQQQQEAQQDQQDQQQAQEGQKQQMSQEEAERLLQAILQKEKDVKKKVDKQKANAKKIKTDKDW